MVVGSGALLARFFVCREEELIDLGHRVPEQRLVILQSKRHLTRARQLSLQDARCRDMAKLIDGYLNGKLTFHRLEVGGSANITVDNRELVFEARDLSWN